MHTHPLTYIQTHSLAYCIRTLSSYHYNTPMCTPQVHEVNCSTLRDKASLLLSLREATRSYQVIGVSIAMHSLILIEEVGFLDSFCADL